MCKVSALIEAHSHECIARLKQRIEYGEIRLCAGVGLYICIGAAEELFRTLDRDRFDLVDHFTAAIITASRISLCIFIGKARAKR